MSKNYFKRAVVMFISFVMMITVFPDVSFTVNAAYENTHVNTGNQREDIVAVAETQIGYHEGSNNDTKYNRWNGTISGYPVGGYGYPWCHCFVSWCANQAGISTNIIPRTAGTSTGRSFFVNQGTYKQSRANGGSYIPQRGDIIYFGSGSSPSHVGIVTNCDGSTVYTIEGNYSDKVGTRAISLSNNYIIGYGVPNYRNDGNNPIGAVDIITSEETGKIRVAGWAYDLDNLNKSIELHMYVGDKPGSPTGHCYKIGAADHGSPDLVANGVNGDHRFDTTVSVSEVGTQNVYIYAINIESGNTNPLIGSDTVQIKEKDSKVPIGAVDAITAYAPGLIRVRGWAYDEDDLNASLDVHVYVGGPAKNGQEGEGHCYVINADGLSPDLNANEVKGNHRFDTLIEVSEYDEQDVYLYAINIENGHGNPMIGSGMVNIENPIPFGAVDIISSEEPGKVRVAGWAYDLDNLDEALELHMYVGGKAGSPTGHCYKIGYANHKSSDLVDNGINGNHRFDVEIPVSEIGEQEIYIYAINIKRGNHNPLIGYGTTYINEIVDITGDINSDGEFNISDVVLLQKWLLAVPDTHLANWQAADLCKDGKLDVFDLCLMKRMLVENS